MKVAIIVILIVAILGGLGVGGYFLFFNDNDKGNDNVAQPTVDIYEISNKSKPTKVTTEVSYVTTAGDTLSGYYVTTIDGNDTIFEYTYDRLYTPAESIEEGTADRVKTLSGVIYYHDGVYSGDQEDWKPGSGTAMELKFHLSSGDLKNPTISEDGTILTAKVSPENAAKIIGTDIRAVEDIDLVVETNGVNLTMITISCRTATGSMTIRTSYTYNVQDLFPEADAA